MLLYAISIIDPLSDSRLYYTPLRGGADVGWTPSLADAWAWEHEAWAEAVRWELARQGHYRTFLHVFAARFEDSDSV